MNVIDSRPESDMGRRGAGALASQVLRANARVRDIMCLVKAMMALALASLVTYLCVIGGCYQLLRRA